mgnify:FL=1
MSLHPSLNKFNGGLTSKSLRNRWDLDKYDSTWYEGTGYIPKKEGTAECMTGTEDLGVL